MRIRESGLVYDGLGVEDGDIGPHALRYQAPVEDAQPLRLQRRHLPYSLLQG